MPPRPGLTLEKITDAAISLLEYEGESGLSLAKLARELGVKPPSLYNHIAGIEDLRRALKLRGFRQLGDDLRRATVGRSGDRALRTMAQAYRGFALRNPALYALTLRSPDEEDDELRQAAGELVDIVYAVLEGYGLSGDQAVHATRIIRSNLHGFVGLEAGGGFALPQGIDDTFELLLVHLDAGLTSLGMDARQ